MASPNSPRRSADRGPSVPGWDSGRALVGGGLAEEACEGKRNVEPAKVMTPPRELNLGANPAFFGILFCFKGRYFAHGIDLPQLRFGPTNGMLGQTKAATIMQFI